MQPCVSVSAPMLFKVAHIFTNASTYLVVHKKHLNKKAPIFFRNMPVLLLRNLDDTDYGAITQ
jgi:hypothetical protein